ATFIGGGCGPAGTWVTTTAGETAPSGFFNKLWATTVMLNLTGEAGGDDCRNALAGIVKRAKRPMAGACPVSPLATNWFPAVTFVTCQVPPVAADWSVVHWR